MWVTSRIPGLLFHRPLFLLLSSPPCLRCALSHSAVSPKDSPLLNKKGDEFLTWLQQKAGREISSSLSVGSSIYGRSLFASRFIHAGECILKVPYSVQITPENIPPDIKFLIDNDIGNISRLAIILLAEKKRGQDSEWAPYVNSLPCIGEMHCTIFWNNDELEMVRQSPIYQETLNQKACIEKEFLAVQPAFEHFPQIFEDVSLEEFMHAYALVGTRAWGTSKGLSLVPFADFLNHDGVSEAVLLSDEDRETSEVIADRDYAAGEQVLIRYGKFSNATLLLDFGFTVPYNIHDQVQIWMDVPSDDPLCLMKSELLRKYFTPKTANITSLMSSNGSFTIKEVRSVHGKGKGIPQSLRAYVRILSAKSVEELKELSIEASENDGRVARYPLKNRSGEIEAHCILLSQIRLMIQDYYASIKLLGLDPPVVGSPLSLRRQMAKDLLTGELRVLKSACSWLTNYCTT